MLPAWKGKSCAKQAEVKCSQWLGAILSLGLKSFRDAKEEKNNLFFLVFLAIKYLYFYLRYVQYLRHSSIVHLIKYCVSLTSIRTGKPKTSCNSLYWYFLYCGNLELNLQNLQGTPVCQIISSVAQLCLPLCDSVDCSTPGFLSITNSWNLLKLMSISRWYHPTISSSVIPSSSCLQSFPAPAAFPMSQLFASGGQRFGVSAWISVLPMNIQDWFPLGWTGWL